MEFMQMTTELSTQSDLQHEADVVAAYVEGALSGMASKCTDRVPLDLIQHCSVDREDHTLLQCARTMADFLKKAAKGQPIQFIRMELIQGGVVCATSSDALDLLPVRAMSAGDVYSGKILKRFEVLFFVQK